MGICKTQWDYAKSNGIMQNTLGLCKIQLDYSKTHRILQPMLVFFKTKLHIDFIVWSFKTWYLILYISVILHEPVSFRNCEGFVYEYIVDLKCYIFNTDNLQFYYYRFLMNNKITTIQQGAFKNLPALQLLYVFINLLQQI